MREDCVWLGSSGQRRVRHLRRDPGKDMKQLPCPKCKVAPRVIRSRTSHNTWCDGCLQVYQRAYRQRPKVQQKARIRNREARAEGRWRERETAGALARRVMYKTRLQVSRRLRHEIEMGRITKPTTCSQCHGTQPRIEGHHEDYSKPLEVKWLCSLCHASQHRARGEK